jgi:hypothetical protein
VCPYSDNNYVFDVLFMRWIQEVLSTNLKFFLSFPRELPRELL